MFCIATSPYEKHIWGRDLFPVSKCGFPFGEGGRSEAALGGGVSFRALSRFSASFFVSLRISLHNERNVDQSRRNLSSRLCRLRPGQLPKSAAAGLSMPGCRAQRFILALWSLGAAVLGRQPSRRQYHRRTRRGEVVVRRGWRR